MVHKCRAPVAVLAAAAMTYACATGAQETKSADEFFEVDAATLLGAPEPDLDGVDDDVAAAARHGRYLVELLGCAACHTDGALIGEPSEERRLAGSSIGIAIDNPLDWPFPSVVYPPNLTPDEATGLGGWSDADIARAIRAGADRHGRRLTPVMPWPGYVKLSEADTEAVVTYLRHLPAVKHNVPKRVPRGRKAREEFVYFGVYQAR
ncbi:MAG: c-type cytochrome [Pseudomonadota bacterium]